MKNVLILLVLISTFGCASTPKTPAVTFDHEDRNQRKKFNNMTSSEVEALVGPSLIKGYDTLEGDDAKNLYRLVYVQKNQAPSNIEDLKKIMKKNKDTGLKCMSFNFSKSFNYKFKSAIAPLSFDFDCNYYRNLKDQE